MPSKAAKEIHDSLPQWDWVDDDPLAAERIRSPALLAISNERGPHGNLFLFGPTGIGKTACLARMVRRWVREAEASGETESLARNLLCTPGYSLESGHSTTLIALAFSVPILIMDGPVTGSPQRGFGAIAGEILHKRLSQPVYTTIVASTVPRVELFDGMRLHEMATGCDIVEDWSYRWEAP